MRLLLQLLSKQLEKVVLLILILDGTKWSVAMRVKVPVEVVPNLLQVLMPAVVVRLQSLNCRLANYQKFQAH